jgi:hypothetical protein
MCYDSRCYDCDYQRKLDEEREESLRKLREEDLQKDLELLKLKRERIEACKEAAIKSTDCAICAA